MEDILIPIIVPLGMFAMVVLIVWLNLSSRRHAKERQAEITAKLIESFSSGEAFAKALHGPEGSKLAESLALEGRKEPKQTWVGLSVPALILSFLGIGFFTLSAFVDADFIIAGVVVGSVGAGLLLAAYVAWRAERPSGTDSTGDRAADAPSADPGGPDSSRP